MKYLIINFIILSLNSLELINKKEHIPTPSHPQKISKKLSPKINNNIKKLNKFE